MEDAVSGCVRREAKERPDLLDASSPEGLSVVQITTAPEFGHSHVYMESPVFTPDSKRFIFMRLRNAEERNARKLQRDYFLCDIDDDFALRRLTDEPGASAPAVPRDGGCAYYIVDASAPGHAKSDVRLKRVRLDSFKRETLAVIDSPLPDCRAMPSRVYALASISPDGRRLCTSAFLGDGRTENAPWALLVFDLESARVQIALSGEEYCNMHPQYCRSEEAARDILVQHNHDSRCDERGNIVKLVGGSGADVHVIRDDGNDFRDMPWGRDGLEFCQGHQCWRGRMRSAVSSMDAHPDHHLPLVESLPMRCSEHHLGKRLSGAMRNVITRDVELPAFCHFAFDPTGTKFVSDTYIKEDLRGRGGLFIGSLDPAPGAALRLRHLLFPRSSWQHGQQSHPHPFLSPDGTKAFFNSDESGQPQIYMIRGFEYP